MVQDKETLRKFVDVAHWLGPGAEREQQRPVPSREKEKIAKRIEQDLRQRHQDLSELLDIHQRNLRIQKKNAAPYDVVPPQIAIPIEKKQEEIAAVKQELAAIEQQLAHIKSYGSDAVAEHYASSLADQAADHPTKTANAAADKADSTELKALIDRAK